MLNEAWLGYMDNRQRGRLVDSDELSGVSAPLIAEALKADDEVEDTSEAFMNARGR